MKRYSTGTDFKFWTLRHAKFVGILSFFFLASSVSAANKPAAKRVFKESEKTIIYSVLDRFKKECVHISILDETKLQEIQTFYGSKKEAMTKEQKDCLENNMTQLVATHNIYKQSCDEITEIKKKNTDADLARLFVNARKFSDGIRKYHEKLNECLLRNGLKQSMILPYSDYEANNRALSRKLREIDLHQPFKDNSVEYR
jgi:hypothetical protein